MTCYMQHLDWLFEELELQRDTETARQLDCAIREALGLPPGEECPQVWAAVKAARDADHGAFIGMISERLS